MKKTLYFATNRKHKGADRWNPKTYGTKFSSDGQENLRFGELSVDLNEAIVKKHLTVETHPNRFGDGEKLSNYICKASKNAVIKAYKDKTFKTKQPLKTDELASTLFFKNIKSKMDEGYDVLIYIHGFNVSWNEAVGGAIALEEMLNQHTKTIVVLFSWPSNGRMLPYISYQSDRADARGSGLAIGRALLKLRDFLQLIKEDTTHPKLRPCGRNINLLCHSMGNYVLQHAIPKLKGYNSGKYLPKIFDNILLCAADVDDTVFEENKGFEHLHLLANKIAVYYNSGDLAMNISDYTKGNRDRLGHSGVANIHKSHRKVSQIDCSKIVTGFVEHSYYLWATVNRDIALTLRGEDDDSSTRNRKQLSNLQDWRLL